MKYRKELAELSSKWRRPTQAQIFRVSRLTEFQVAEVLERHNRSDRTGELTCDGDLSVLGLGAQTSRKDD